MASTLCDKEVCCGCSACESICPQEAIAVKDEVRYTNAVIDETLCTDCGLCRKVCPNNSEPVFREPIKWYQGWSRDQELRRKSASGGLAQAISREFVKNGDYVCSCLFEEGEFVFKLTDSLAEVEKFRGSKYVKSNPEGCYQDILGALRESDRKVLFIGLPCQVAAVKNYVGKSFDERLYTIDLICHGTPSAKLLSRFLAEHKIGIKQLNEIRFRQKRSSAVEGDHLIENAGIMDEYMFAFMSSASLTENCYRCQFAREERVSDLTLGDSWGSELAEELDKGLSLILCQTDKGRSLLEGYDLELRAVDVSRALQHNGRLREPPVRPEYLDRFFSDIENGKTLKRTVLKYFRKSYGRQQIKKLLIKCGLYKIRGKGYAVSIKQIWQS